MNTLFADLGWITDQTEKKKHFEFKQAIIDLRFTLGHMLLTASLDKKIC